MWTVGEGRWATDNYLANHVEKGDFWEMIDVAKYPYMKKMGGYQETMKDDISGYLEPW